MSKTTTDSSGKPVLVLFRNDLRIADNAALSAAADSGSATIPVFIFDGAFAGRECGAASRWWLHFSLTALADGLARLGAPLIVRTGDRAKTVAALVRQCGAGAVFWNRSYDPASIDADGSLADALRKDGVRAEMFDGQLLHEPSRLKTGSGGHYKVYTPFWRALDASNEPRDPIDAPKSLEAGKHRLDSDAIESLGLLPKSPDWAEGLRERWTPGEQGAHERLSVFLEDRLHGYGPNRDLPAIDGTSMLSPHLAHGEITPFQILAALRRSKMSAKHRADAEKFRKELCWREFNYHQLFHNPKLATKNFNDVFDAFPWAGTGSQLKKWQHGLTGYPIVDAGMRQLWQTGWMHNRVRLIVGSFLAKHLLIDWRKGEQWFWDTLVDADPANNPGNWQWVAGSGADASPFFRIFNPILQGEKFDTEGVYVRQFVPELAKIPNKFIHKPWQAPAAILTAAGVKLGQTYPVPLVDHGDARERAMQAFRTMRGHT